MYALNIIVFFLPTCPVDKISILALSIMYKTLRLCVINSFTAPTVAPGNLSIASLKPTSVTLSWEPIPLDEQNGDLIYIVNIIIITLIDTGGGHRKRDTNTLKQCLSAAGVEPSYNISVPGNTTSVTVTELSEFFITASFVVINPIIFNLPSKSFFVP